MSMLRSKRPTSTLTILKLLAISGALAPVLKAVSSIRQSPHQLAPKTTSTGTLACCAAASVARMSVLASACSLYGASAATAGVITLEISAIRARVLCMGFLLRQWLLRMLLALFARPVVLAPVGKFFLVQLDVKLACARLHPQLHIGHRLVADARPHFLQKEAQLVKAHPGVNPMAGRRRSGRCHGRTFSATESATRATALAPVSMPLAAARTPTLSPCSAALAPRSIPLAAALAPRSTAPSILLSTDPAGSTAGAAASFARAVAQTEAKKQAATTARR